MQTFFGADLRAAALPRKSHYSTMEGSTIGTISENIRGPFSGFVMTPGIRKLTISIAMIVVVIAAGLVIANWLYATRPAAEKTALPTLPMLVRVQQMNREDIQVRYSGYGTARADRDVSLAAEVSGAVVEVSEGLNDGVLVNEGDLLVRIDDRPYRQQLVRSEAAAADLAAQIQRLEVEKDNIQKLISISNLELEVNRVEMERLADLFEKQLASKKEFDFARLAHQRSLRETQGLKNDLALIEPRRAALEATHAARIAEAEMASIDVGRCRIVAPFAGQIERLAVHVGDLLMPGSEVVRLVSTRLIEIPIELPASVRHGVNVGASCALSADSMSGVEWSGRIARVAPSADPQSRTFAAYIEVDNLDQDIPLVPGYFVQAQVEGPILAQSLAVPRGAIVDGQVFIVNDSQAHARAVTVDRYVGDLAIVNGELGHGDRLIVSNLDVLVDGAEVRVASGAPSESDPISPVVAEYKP